MPSDVAALPPPDLPVASRRPDPADIPRPDVPDISFRELWKDKQKGFTFSDFLDIVNPLQHLPVIGTIYRAVTGDTISLGARLFGGALYGGPIGVMGEAALAAADQAVGGDPGRKFVAFVGELFDGGSDSAAAEVAKVETAAGGATGQADPAVATPQADGASAIEAPTDAPSDPTAVISAPATAPILVPAGPKPAVGATPAATAVAPPANAQPLREFPAFPRWKPSSHGVMLPLHPGLGPLRGEPTLPFIPGATTGAQPGPGPRADAKPASADSKRIAAEIDAAQRAQTGLLLASLGGGATPLPSAGMAGDDGARTGGDKRRQPADPFQNHPFIPPPGASPAWVGKAMEQALVKYQQSQLLRQSAPGAGSGGAANASTNGAAASGAADPSAGE